MRESNRNRADRHSPEEFGTVVVGRNPVMELLKSGREIEKLYVQRGEREGSITKIFAEARKRSIVISEVDRSVSTSLRSAMRIRASPRSLRR